MVVRLAKVQSADMIRILDDDVVIQGLGAAATSFSTDTTLTT